MENKRSTGFKLKIIFILVGIVFIGSYIRSQFGQIPRTSSQNRFNDAARNKLSDSMSDKKLSDHLLHSKVNRLDENPVALPKKEAAQKRLDHPAEKIKIGSNNANKEVHKSKAEEGVGNEVRKSIATSNEKMNKTTDRYKATNNRPVANNTAHAPKMTLKTVTMIVREILDRLNISRSETEFGKQLETSKLSHSEVGNISKEILRKNFSVSLAKAVISVLTKGDPGSSRNYTLGKLLWADYTNHSMQSNSHRNYGQQNQIRDYAKRASYRDKYEQLKGNNPYKRPLYYNSQRRNNQIYRENNKRPAKVHNQVALRYRDKVKSANNVEPQPWNRHPSIGESRQMYKDNRPHGRNISPSSKSSYKLTQRLRSDRQSSLREDKQARFRHEKLSRNTDEKQNRYRDKKKPFKYTDINQLSKHRDNNQHQVKRQQQRNRLVQHKIPVHEDRRAQQPMNRNQRQKHWNQPAKKQSETRDQHTWYRDNTQQRFLMDHPEEKQSIKNNKRVLRELNREIKTN